MSDGPGRVNWEMVKKVKSETWKSERGTYRRFNASRTEPLTAAPLQQLDAPPTTQ